MLKLLLLLCGTLDLEGQSLPLHLRLKLKENRKIVSSVCMNVVQKNIFLAFAEVTIITNISIIVNYVVNLHLRISES